MLNSSSEVVLRVHHGFLLKRAKANGVDSESVRSILNARRSCDYSNPTGHLQEYLADYYDYFGSFPPEGSHNIPYLVSKDEALYQGRLRASINRYLTLDSETNLRLTALGEDWICESYCHKTHCSLETVFTNHERKMASQLAEWKKKQNIPGKFYVREGFDNSDFFASTMGVFLALMDSVKDPVEVFCDR